MAPRADTIVAVATAPGPGARAIVRLSGPATGPALARLIEADPTAPGVHRVRARLGNDRSLPALLLRFAGPRSYTGEDAAEILLPSNQTLLERVLDRACVVDGVRPAGPGEFTARAYLAGKLSLAQAEGVAASIAAESAAQLDAAGRLVSGQTGRRYDAWLERGATLLALVEAGVDFSDQEDVVPIAPRELSEAIGTIVSELDTTLGPATAREPASALPRVVLAGAPNAGKSTLFNALLGRPRAVVAPTPGTTRDVLVEELELTPDPSGPTPGHVLLVDLAGIGADAVDATDQSARELARDAISTADVVVQCDPTGRFTELADAAPGARVVRVRTKADLPMPAGASEELAICALDGYHLPALRRAIADAASISHGPGAGEAVVPRHRRALAEAAERLRAALELVDPAARTIGEPALVAGELRLALDRLGELAGHVTPDDVIGRVFSTFCVGK